MARPRAGAIRKSPKKYKWCGRTLQQNIEVSASTSVTEVLQLCEANSSPESINDFVIERILMWVGIRRLTTAEVGAVAGIFAIQTVSNAGALTEVLEPLNVMATEREFMVANKEILHYRLFNVPPVLANGFDDTFEISKAVEVTAFEYKSRRRISLSRHSVTWTLAADASDVLSQFVVGCVLLSY